MLCECCNTMLVDDTLIEQAYASRGTILLCRCLAMADRACLAAHCILIQYGW